MGHVRVDIIQIRTYFGSNTIGFFSDLGSLRIEFRVISDFGSFGFELGRILGCLISVISDFRSFMFGLGRDSN
jgi:hypothetical protein